MSANAAVVRSARWFNTAARSASSRSGCQEMDKLTAELEEFTRTDASAEGAVAEH